MEEAKLFKENTYDRVYSIYQKVGKQSIYLGSLCLCVINNKWYFKPFAYNIVMDDKNIQDWINEELKSLNG